MGTAISDIFLKYFALHQDPIKMGIIFVHDNYQSDPEENKSRNENQSLAL